MVSSRLLHPKHLHYLIPQMIYHLHCNSPRLRLRKGPGCIAVKRFPGFLVDLGFERSTQGIIAIIGSQEVRVTDKETFLVIVGVNEPARDALRTVTSNFPCTGAEHVNTLDLHL